MVQCATGADILGKGPVPKTAIELLHENILSMLQANSYDPSSILLPAIVPEDVALKTTSALLSGNNILFYGPPGTGKSLTATTIRRMIFNFPVRWVVAYPASSKSKDTITKFKLPSGKIIPIKGVCPVGCHPASIYDKKYRRKVEPCPVCKIEYSQGNIEAIGDFPIIPPESVYALQIKIRDGYGTKRIQCSPETTPEKLVGRLNIRKYLHDEEIGGDPSDPRVFDPGDLLQSFLISHLDELCKLPVASQQTLLQATEEREVNPSGIDMPFPRKAIDVATTNEEDLSRIIQPLNDRFTNIFFPYESETLPNHTDAEKILGLGLYQEHPDQNTTTLSVSVPAGPDFCNKPISRHSIFPKYLERTVVDAIRAYRNQEIWKKVKESGSHRVMIDTATNAMTHAILRTQNPLSVATVQDVKLGFDLAITGRIRGYENELEELCDKMREAIKRINLDYLALEHLKKYVCDFVVTTGSEKAKQALEELEPIFRDPKTLEVYTDPMLSNRAGILDLIDKNTNVFVQYILNSEKIPKGVSQEVAYQMKTILVANIGTEMLRNQILDTLCE
jgi:DNA polymerase III delta prime subunit